MKLKWTNWQIYQQITGNTLQQVDNQLAKVILKAGYSWSPAMSQNQPIILTPLRKRGDVGILAKLGFELEEDTTVTPSLQNGFDYSGYLSSSWEAFGLKQTVPDEKVEEEEKNEPEDPHNKMSISDFVQELGSFWDQQQKN